MLYLLYSPPEPPVLRCERLQSVHTERRTWIVTGRWEYARSSEVDELLSDNWREGEDSKNDAYYSSCVRRT